MKPNAQAFVAAYLSTIKDGKGNATKAAEMAGFSKRSAYNQGARLMKNDEVKAAIASALNRATEDAQVNVTYIVKSLRTVVERCMQGEEIIDVTGRPTGIWRFDAAGANRSLELLGKHLKMFTDRFEVEVIDNLADRLKEARLRRANQNG